MCERCRKARRDWIAAVQDDPAMIEPIGPIIAAIETLAADAATEGVDISGGWSLSMLPEMSLVVAAILAGIDLDDVEPGGGPIDIDGPPRSFVFLMEAVPEMYPSGQSLVG